MNAHPRRRDARGRFVRAEPGAEHLAALLGGEVPTTVRVVTDGFTPGRKRVVSTSDGRSLFVKFAPATSWVAAAYATAAAAHDWLPESATGGLLVGRRVDASGTTLVFRAIDEPDPGRNGWTSAGQLRMVLRALTDVFRDIDDAAPPGLGSEIPTFWAERTFWRACEAGTLRPPAGLRANLRASLARSERHLMPALTDSRYADEVAHHDLRRDNILIGTGGVFVVDWNWANRSPRVGDAVCLGIDAAVHGIDPELVLSSDGPFCHYDDETVNAALAGAAGYFAEAARVSAGAPRALTALRRASARAAVAWFANRTS